MGRLAIVIAPTMTMSREITIATIGRLMKKRDTSGSCLGRLLSDDIDDGAVSDLLQALDNHAFPGLQTVGHDPELPDTVADRHRTDRHLVIRAHDRYLITALQFGYGSLRNE